MHRRTERRRAGNTVLAWPLVMTALGIALAACSAPVDDMRASEGSDTFKVGGMVTATGDLAEFGRGLVTALNLAAEDINAAGGVNGVPLELISLDDGTDPQVSRSVAGQLIGQGVRAIVGPTSSRLTLAVVDDVTQAGIVQCSPAATSPELTDYPDDGLFFRAAASDVSQGAALANAVWSDGHKTAAILAVNDPYGQGLAESFTQAFEAKGGEIVENVAHDPKETDFGRVAGLATSPDPEALVLVGSGESRGEVLEELISQGKGPQVLPTYGGEGYAAEGLLDAVEPADPSAIDGLTATTPAFADEDFRGRLRDADPEIAEDLYSPNAYDCLMLIALGAEAADSNDPAVFSRSIVAVTRGEHECNTFEQCSALLKEGKTIHYEGVSGPLDLTDRGEPQDGEYDLVRWRGGETKVLFAED